MPSVRFVAALLAAAALDCAAAPFAVQLGDVRIGLDSPPGFADTTMTGSPRLLELGEALTSASNRILLFAISDADLRRFTVGDQLDLRRYMVVVTPRTMERERVNDAAFKQLVAEATRNVGPPPTEKDYLKYLEGKPIGAALMLTELRRDPDVVTVLYGSRAKAGGWFEKEKYVLTTTTLLHLRSRALVLSVYTMYEDASDLEWIRIATLRWIEDLKKLNTR